MAEGNSSLRSSPLKHPHCLSFLPPLKPLKYKSPLPFRRLNRRRSLIPISPTPLLYRENDRASHTLPPEFETAKEDISIENNPSYSKHFTWEVKKQVWPNLTTHNFDSSSCQSAFVVKDRDQNVDKRIVDLRSLSVNKKLKKFTLQEILIATSSLSCGSIHFLSDLKSLYTFPLSFRRLNPRRNPIPTSPTPLLYWENDRVSHSLPPELETAKEGISVENNPSYSKHFTWELKNQVVGEQEAQEIHSSRDPLIATSSVSGRNILGKGSSGTVYQGKLSCGKRVAVKCFSSREPEAWQTFRNEIEIMGGFVRNRHIVPLLGFASEGQQLFLVYKYIKRGSLEKHLSHGKGKNGLSWTVRCKIALGIAKALHYLHYTCQRAVIHRDVKSSNILLSKSKKPLLSDFGLSMWAPPSFLICNDIMGTFGYLAPEYFQFGKLSSKIDVYAFGVVLLELITGRKPIDTSKPYGEENLVLWARPLLHHGCIEELVDSRLQGSYCKKRMKRMIWTASLCLHPSDTCRPSMNQVLHLLERGPVASVKLWLKHGYTCLSSITLDCKLSEDEQRKAQMVKEDERKRHLAMAMTGSEEDENVKASLLTFMAT